MKLIYKYRKARVVIRRAWLITAFNKKEKYSSDIEMALKIVKRMLTKPDVDIRHSSIYEVFHIKCGHLYAKISEGSITIINGRYAYELIIPLQVGYDLIQKIRSNSERKLMKAETEHRKRINRSLLNVYNSLDEEDTHDQMALSISTEM